MPSPTPRLKHVREPEAKLTMQELQNARDEIEAIRRRHREEDEEADDSDNSFGELAPFVTVTDKEFLLEAVQNDPLALAYASEQLCDDAEVVNVAVSLSGRSLQFASESLRSDHSVVLTAVRTDWAALEFVADPALFEDPNIMFTAVAQSRKAIPYVSARLLGDLLFVRAIVAIDSLALAFVSEELRKDRDIALLALEHNLTPLCEALDEIRQCGYVDFTLQGHVNFHKGGGGSNGMLQQPPTEGGGGGVVTTLANAANAAAPAASAGAGSGAGVEEVGAAAGRHVDIKLPHLVALPESDIERHLRKQLGTASSVAGAPGHDDDAAAAAAQSTLVVLDASRRDGRVLQFASDELRQDQEVVFLAVSHDPSALEFASEALRGHDPEFVLRTIAIHGGRSLRCVLEPLASDRRFLVNAAVQHAKALRYVAPDLRHDREFILSIVREAAAPLRYAPAEMCDDAEIMLAAVANDGGALTYASPALCTNQEFLLAAVKLRGEQRREEEPDFGELV